MSVRLTVSLPSGLAKWIEEKADSCNVSEEDYCLEILASYQAYSAYLKERETREKKGVLSKESDRGSEP
ncbi:MAG: hypothetical protein AAGB46_06080 [Verrucomicrobiota bacterium]